MKDDNRVDFRLLLGLVEMSCTTGCVSSTNLWSAKDSSFSALSVPADANIIVVSRSAMIPDTAVAAVMQAWVPLLPAWRAESTKDTWGHEQTINHTGEDAQMKAFFAHLG